MIDSASGPHRFGPGSEEPAFAPLFIETVRIRNFRGIADCRVVLEPDLTLLVGRNNSGKSRLLRALAIALGGVPAERDDLSYPAAGEATIDIVLAPRCGPGPEQVFDQKVTRRLAQTYSIGSGPTRERFAWRTTLFESREGFGVFTRHVPLVYESAVGDWVFVANAPQLTLDQRAIVSADLFHTSRDLAEDMGRRNSPIRRILDDLEIPADLRRQLESRLKSLGDDIVEDSDSLTALRASLGYLADSVDGLGAASLTALPVRLEDLARSVSIDFNTGTGSLPIRFHGSGSRSLSALQVQSVLYQRRLGRDGPALLPHPVSLIEEPEAHLHPQAQLELPTLLETAQGQVVATTHSALLSSIVEPRCLRLLGWKEGGPVVRDLSGLEGEDVVEKLRRLVERPFGELLFAAAVVVVDGATERAFLPPVLRSALGRRAYGVSVVDTNGMGTPYAFAVVRFAERVGMPWILFADSDRPGRTAADRILQAFHGSPTQVVWSGSGAPVRSGALEKLLCDFDEATCRAACETLGPVEPGTATLTAMKSSKGAIGHVLAREFLRAHPWSDGASYGRPDWPAPLVELVTKVHQIMEGDGAGAG